MISMGIKIIGQTSQSSVGNKIQIWKIFTIKEYNTLKI